MDGLARSVGDGITGMVAGAFEFVGNSIRGIVSSANAVLPGGLLVAVVFVVLILFAWNLAKR